MKNVTLCHHPFGARSGTVLKASDLRSPGKTIVNTGMNEPLADGVADAAKRLGVSKGLLYKLHKAGKVKLVKLAGRTLMTRAEQARLLAEAQ